MKTWLKIDDTGLVVNSVVFEDGVTPLISLPDGWTWKQNDTFGVGSIFLQNKNKFVISKPFASWTLNSNDEWVAPTSKPTGDKSYWWDEPSLTWKTTE